MTLKDKLAAVKRWSAPTDRQEWDDDCVCMRTVWAPVVDADKYDALLRALDVALRQRDEWIQLHFSGDVSEHFQQEKARMKDDAEILAAFLKDDNDKTS